MNDKTELHRITEEDISLNWHIIGRDQTSEKSGHLNNRAISLLDLEHEQEAERYWKDFIKA